MEQMYFLQRFNKKGDMKWNNIIGVVLTIGLFSISSCNKDEPSPIDDPSNQPYVTTPYTIDVPIGFPDLIIPEDNKTTIEGVALGRMLYYDNILDKDSARSCATCHIQNENFQTDNGSDQILSHINFAWSNNFMWNGGFTGTLEEVMLFEVEHFFETNIARLNANEEYKKRFKQAFDVDEITSKEAAYALAQFQRIMISSNSKFDKYMRGQAMLTDLEMQGMILYNTEEADCFHCHGTSLFTDNIPRNNGLDEFPEDGLMAVTGIPMDLGRFKTPSLRNIEFTAPYMHDGRFQTLEEVVDFYSTGVHNTATVDPLMVYAYKGGVDLSDDDKKALIAFLKTLSDTDYLTNTELSDPFN